MVEFLVSQKSFGGARLSRAYGKRSTPTGRNQQRAPNRAGRVLWGHAEEPEQPVLWDLQDRWVCFSVATVMIDGLGMEKETGRKEQEDNACDFSKQLERCPAGRMLPAVGLGDSEDIAAWGGEEGRGEGQAEPRGASGAKGAEAERAKAVWISVEGHKGA